jgi:ArsR family transcriptional regulator
MPTDASSPGPGFDDAVARLRAAAEPSRLRLLALLAQAELTVTEITQVLGQSQPRVSRHLKVLCDAGLLERHREGAWILYRVPDEGAEADLARHLAALVPDRDPVLAADAAALDHVRHARAEAGAAYFRANAAQWERIRSLYVPEAEVEAAMLDLLGPGPIDRLLDIGTGTGRVLEVLAPQIGRGVGLDSSHDMLSIARANIQRAGLERCSVRHGDLHRPPFPARTFDTVVLHQVLHYLEDPADAILQSASMLAPGGRLLVADFAPHDLEFLQSEHEHRRLGIGDAELQGWAARAGLRVAQARALPAGGEGELTVMVWLLRHGPARSTARSADVPRLEAIA